MSRTTRRVIVLASYTRHKSRASCRVFCAESPNITLSVLKSGGSFRRFRHVCLGAKIRTPMPRRHPCCSPSRLRWRHYRLRIAQRTFLGVRFRLRRCRSAVVRPPTHNSSVAIRGQCDGHSLACASDCAGADQLLALLRPDAAATGKNPCRLGPPTAHDSSAAVGGQCYGRTLADR
jgi:hypothetical protein